MEIFLFKLFYNLLVLVSSCKDHVPCVSAAAGSTRMPKRCNESSIQHFNTTPQHNVSTQNITTTQHLNTMYLQNITQSLNTTSLHKVSTQHLNTTPLYNFSTQCLNRTSHNTVSNKSCHTRVIFISFDMHAKVK